MNDREILVSFGRRVSSLRCAREWSIDDLATRAAMPVSDMEQLESGTKSATLVQLCRLARSFGIKLSELFDFNSPGDTTTRE